MIKQDFQTSIAIAGTGYDAFHAINDVAKWWTENVEGSSSSLNDVFTVRFGETYITLKVIESIPHKRIVWMVIDSHKHWLKNKNEWNWTQLIWEIEESNTETQIKFTHLGLTPNIECYGICEKSWQFYVQLSLFGLLINQLGTPEKKRMQTQDKPAT
jgi:hypothetical protein